MKKLKSVCRNCDYYFRKAVWGKGNKDADVMIIGQNPGYHEALHGEPFYPEAYAGGIVRKGLKEAGFEIQELFFDNVCKCHSPDNEAPSDEVIEKCKPYLDHVIKLIKPKMIIALGVPAVKFFTNRASIKDIRGKVFDYNGIKVVPTYHPAARRAYQKKLMLEDLKFAKGILEGKESLTELTEYVLLKDLSSIKKVVKDYTKKRGYLFLDVETSGLVYWKDRIITIQFSKEKGLAYIISIIENGKHVWDDAKLIIIRKELSKLLKDNIVVGQNVKFDLKFCHSFGIDVLNLVFYDTMVMQYLIDENSERNLDILCSLYSPELGYYFVPIRKWKNNMLETPLDILYPYAAGDVDCLSHIFPLMVKELKDQNLWNYYLNHWVANGVTTLKMELRGMGVDVDLIEEVDIGEGGLEDKEDELRNDIFKYVGDEFNINSPKQLSKVLFDNLNLPVIKQTEKGEPSTDKEVLEKLQDKHPIIESIQSYRVVNKLRTKDIKALKIHSESPDGRIHCNIRNDGTVSGRYSCTDPNLMNIPTDNERLEGVSLSIRKLFIAPDGFELIVADYSQIELFILGILAGEQSIIRNLYEGEGDIHHETTIGIFGDEYLHYKNLSLTEKFKTLPINNSKKIKVLENLKRMRRIAKAVNFGVVYVISVDGLARNLRINQEEAEKFIEKFFDRYPKILEYRGNIIDEIEEKGYLESPFGHRRRFPDFEPIGHQLRQAVNFKSQHCAAIICQRAKQKIIKDFEERYIKGDLTFDVLMSIPYVINIVYDNIITETPKDLSDEVSKIIIDNMRQPIPELDNHSFLIEVGKGRSWSEAEMQMEKVK